MFEPFREYLQKRATLTAEEFALLEEASIPKTLKRRQYLLQEGEVSKHAAFVVRGCLRVYSVDDKGEEHIMRFAVENWWCSDRESYITGQPSKYYIEALEDSELLLWSKAVFEDLLKRIPDLKSFSDDLLAKSFITSQNRVHAAITFSAEERYNDFLKKYPDLQQRVPLHMIASFLGITPVTLSRIRSQAAKK